MIYDIHATHDTVIHLIAAANSLSVRPGHRPLICGQVWCLDKLYLISNIVYLIQIYKHNKSV